MSSFLLKREEPKARQLDLFIHFGVDVGTRDSFKKDILGRIEQVEKSADRCRRRQFAQLGKMGNKLEIIDQRLALIEAAICKGVI